MKASAFATPLPQKFEGRHEFLNGLHVRCLSVELARFPSLTDMRPGRGRDSEARESGTALARFPWTVAVAPNDASETEYHVRLVFAHVVL